MGGETKHIRGVRSRTLIPRDKLYSLHIAKYYSKYKNIKPLGIANFLNTALHYYFSLKMFENFGLTQEVDIDFKDTSEGSIATILQNKYGNVVDVNYYIKKDDNNKIPNRKNYSAFKYLEQYRSADIQAGEQNSKESYIINGNNVEVAIDYGIYTIDNIEYKVELEDIDGDILAKIEEDAIGLKVKLLETNSTNYRYEYFTLRDESIYIVSYNDSNANEHLVYLWASEAEQTVLQEKAMILTIKKDKEFVYDNRYKKVLLHKYGLLSKGRNEKSLIESLEDNNIKDAFITFAYPTAIVEEDEEGNSCDNKPEHYDIYQTVHQIYWGDGSNKRKVTISGNQIDIVYDYDEPNIQLNGTIHNADKYCININGTKSPTSIIYTEHPEACDFTEKLLIYPLSLIKKKSIRDKFRYLEFGFQLILVLDQEVKLEWWQSGVFAIIIDIFEIAIGVFTQNYYLVASGAIGLLGDTGIIDADIANIAQMAVGVMAIDFTSFGLLDTTKILNYGSNLYTKYIQEQIAQTQREMQEIEYRREQDERELETYKNKIDLPILSYESYEGDYLTYGREYDTGYNNFDIGYNNFGYN